MSWMSELHAYQQENPELSTLGEVVKSYRATTEGKKRATIEFPQSMWNRINSVAHIYAMSSSEFIRLCMADAVNEKIMHQIPWIAARSLEADMRLEAVMEEQAIADAEGKESGIEWVGEL